ncbi:MAG: hypothetical protein DCF19_02695 [Pseudanabaena frigida]|uniref:Uncharacterized protein n=1 Tax=Pseudanabaena frigida TaxID=945775 RepID=A0A2W4Y9M1_9CYAN|nr:MAG: hypothetical protein DCF19_02695 [Pseudanabaena frigida]
MTSTHNHLYESAFYSADLAIKSNNNMTLPNSFLFPAESLLPAIAAAFFLMFSIYILAKDARPVKNGWIFPAALSILFLLFSLKAIASEGLLGFWFEHTDSLWGNQVWFDLLLGVGIGWYLIVPIPRYASIPLVRTHCLHWLYRFLSDDRTPTILTGLCCGRFIDCRITQRLYLAISLTHRLIWLIRE